MDLSVEFLDALAVAAGRSSGPHTIPWPTRGDLAGFLTFESYASWQQFFLGFRLPHGVPQVITHGFERAQKLYLLGWIDPDLIAAGELVALSTLELAVKDRYLSKERNLRMALIVEEARKAKREVSKRERKQAERISFADLLKFMVEHDDLADDKLPMIRRCGGSVRDLLTGDRNPSLADMRNIRAHGDPFGSGLESGLLELIRDLIEYAYRGMIAEARVSYPDEIPEGMNF